MNNQRGYPIIKVLLIFLLVGALFSAPLEGQPVSASQAASLQSYIVQGPDVDLLITLVRTHGGEVTSRLDVIGGIGARLPESEVAGLQSHPAISSITPNAQARLTAQEFDKIKKHTPATDYPEAVGADLLWEQGVTGEGVTVAILDTGIANHPYFLVNTKGKKKDPVVAWKDFIDGKRSPDDPNGHGTHIAGIIANATKGSDGGFNGVAPGVNLVVGRVLDKTGSGTYESVIEGIQWVIANKDRYNIKVLNLSLYSLVQSPYWADPLNQAVMRAWADGITVVVAAVNNGPNPMSIAVPGNVPYLITVGAFTDNYTPSDWNDDYLASFSSAGPTLYAFVKPDLVAPGAHIVSTMMPNSYIALHHEGNWVDGFYFSMAGTSQAAAVVSGAAALLAQNNPGLTPDQVKYRLMVTSLPWIDDSQTDFLYSAWQQGAGRVNAYDASLATDINTPANNGLDIQADMAGTSHFEGYSYYDEATQSFLLHGFESIASSYGSWAGSYADPSFVLNFMNGIPPELATTTSRLQWVEER